MRRWLVVLVLLVAGCGASETPVVTSPVGDGSPVAWDEAATSPLPSRARAVLVWTGDEVLVLGGDSFSCPPAASCVAPTEAPRADGAAYDIDGATWRTLADAPVGFHSAAGTAVVGGDVYILAMTDYESGRALLRYRIVDDAWAELPPPADDVDWYQLVAAGDHLLAYVSSEEQGVTGDVVLADDGETWEHLPADPLSAGFNRSMVWSDPDLYLFDQENVPSPGSERPSIVRGARLDLDAGTWERLPDSEMLGGWGTWLADDGRLISPMLGGADGGEVNGYGRALPFGGVFDIGGDAWASLPDPPEAPRAGQVVATVGAVNESSAVYLGTHGWLLDATTDTWHEVEPIPNIEDQDPPPVLAAGRVGVAFVRNALWTLTPD